MPGSQPAVLTYHSQQIGGHDTSNNDHVALARDLEQLHRAGARIEPLSRLVDWLSGDADDDRRDTVYLTFDDGCDFDVRDLAWPGVGLQRSFLGIMRDFVDRHGTGAQPGLHATSFVIASASARRLIDARSLFGKGWMRDDWWHEANASGLLTIGNHGWDHNHPDLEPEAHGRGGFTSVDDLGQCERQVVEAARFIEGKAGAWPQLFAYPFGEWSDYIRQEFFPQHAGRHRCRAAFGTEPGPVSRFSDRWNLPRFVCGRDWRSPEELLRLLKEQ